MGEEGKLGSPKPCAHKTDTDTAKSSEGGGRLHLVLQVQGACRNGGYCNVGLQVQLCGKVSHRRLKGSSQHVACFLSTQDQSCLYFRRGTQGCSPCVAWLFGNLAPILHCSDTPRTTHACRVLLAQPTAAYDCSDWKTWILSP